MLKPGIFTTRLDIKPWAHFSVCNHCRSFTNYHWHSFPSNAYGNLEPLAHSQIHPRKGTTNFSPFRNHGLHWAASPVNPSGVKKATWIFSSFWEGGSFIWWLCRRRLYLCPMRHSCIISSLPKQESHFHTLIFSCILLLLSRNLVCSSMLAYRQNIFSYRSCSLALFVLQRLSFWDLESEVCDPAAGWGPMGAAWGQDGFGGGLQLGSA